MPEAMLSNTYFGAAAKFASETWVSAVCPQPAHHSAYRATGIATTQTRARQAGPVPTATAAPTANGIPRLEKAKHRMSSAQARRSPVRSSRRSASNEPRPAAIEPK